MCFQFFALSHVFSICSLSHFLSHFSLSHTPSLSFFTCFACSCFRHIYPFHVYCFAFHLQYFGFPLICFIIFCLFSIHFLRTRALLRRTSGGPTRLRSKGEAIRAAAPWSARQCLRKYQVNACGLWRADRLPKLVEGRPESVQKRRPPGWESHQPSVVRRRDGKSGTSSSERTSCALVIDMLTW